MQVKKEGEKISKMAPGAFCGSERLCAQLLHSSGMLSQPRVGISQNNAGGRDWCLPFCPFLGPCLQGQAVQTLDGRLCTLVLKGRILPGS